MKLQPLCAISTTDVNAGRFGIAATTGRRGEPLRPPVTSDNRHATAVQRKGFGRGLADFGAIIARDGPIFAACLVTLGKAHNLL